MPSPNSHAEQPLMGVLFPSPETPKADVSHSCDVGGRETARLRNHVQRVGAERMEKERWDERMFYWT